MTEYEDFRLRITSKGGGQYSVEADGAEGETALATFELPFTADDIEGIADRVGQTRRVTRGRQVTAVQKAQAFGTQLFDTVFSGDIHELYRTACQRVEDRDAGIRLLLSLRNAPELLDVPWEFLFDRPYWLSLRRTTPVVRVLELSRVRNPVRINGRIRVLGMVSSPAGYPPLNVEGERHVVDGALSPLVERGLAEVVWLPNASLSALNQTLLTGDFHVFHYIGHAGFDSASNEGHLVLEHSDGTANEVTGSDLGTILCDHRPLRLAVINACEGARASPEDPFTGVATSLAEREIPAIVSMQFEITDTAALVFAQTFYSTLVEGGEPVDVAVAAARKGLYADNPSALEWGTPVLFMRTHDVNLFDFQNRTVDPTPSPPPVERGRVVTAPPDEGPPVVTAPLVTRPDPVAAPDPVSLAPKAEVPHPDEPPAHLDPRPDDRRIDVATSRGDAMLRADEAIDLRHGSPLVSAAMSREGRLVATVGADNALIAWSADDGSPFQRWTGFQGPHDVSVNHDGTLAAVGADNGCWVFSTGSAKTVALLSPGKDFKRPVTAVEFTPDRAGLIAGNDRGVVERWTIDRWRSVGKEEGPRGTGAVTRLASDPTGRCVAVATSSGQVWFWDPSRKPWTSAAVPRGFPVADLTWAEGGLAAATGTAVVLIDTTVDRVRRSESLTSAVTTLDLMAGSMWLVAATADCQVKAWDGSGVLRLETRSNSVLCRVRFTAHGLLTAGADGIGRLWRVTAAG